MCPYSKDFRFLFDPPHFSGESQCLVPTAKTFQRQKKIVQNCSSDLTTERQKHLKTSRPIFNEPYIKYMFCYESTIDKIMEGARDVHVITHLNHGS